jgi:HK97 family phage portal protein
MKLFGVQVPFTRKAAVPATLSNVPQRGWFRIAESFAGAWQRNVTIDGNAVLANPTMFACITLIAADVSKLRVRLVEKIAEIWKETESPAFSPVLRKPNAIMNRIQFYACWIISKLTNGNTYVLKERDARGVVVALYVLDPRLVTPLVAPNGDVYYRLQRDDLSAIPEGGITVPAFEIIHDRMNTLFHPLVGLSPIFAAGLSAVHGLEIIQQSTLMARNASRPAGILTAPGEIDQADADRLKAYWAENYTGENAGKIAVLGSGLKFEKLSVDAVDNQLAEQLKWSDEKICSCFHVPAYMVGVGGAPTYNNINALNQQYYAQCLQIHIESIELCLDEGLALPSNYGTEFDLDGLLRMDTATQFEALQKGVAGGFLAPNEARRKLDLPKLTGGDTVYLQQQQFSLEALAKRDAKEDPFASKAVTAPAAEPQAKAGADDDDPDTAKALEAYEMAVCPEAEAA